VVVPPCQPDALADAICWGANHRGELAAMGRRARSLAEDRFDRRIAIREFEDLFFQLLRSGAKARPIGPGPMAGKRHPRLDTPLSAGSRNFTASTASDVARPS